MIGRLVHTSVANTGSFTSSDPLYNQIHQAMQRTILNGLLGYPAIDPANERNGWSGDTQLIAPSETDNFGMDAFLVQWLNDIQDGQRADGSISLMTRFGMAAATAMLRNGLPRIRWCPGTSMSATATVTC